MEPNEPFTPRPISTWRIRHLRLSGQELCSPVMGGCWRGGAWQAQALIPPRSEDAMTQPGMKCVCRECGRDLTEAKRIACRERSLRYGGAGIYPASRSVYVTCDNHERPVGHIFGCDGFGRLIAALDLS